MEFQRDPLKEENAIQLFEKYRGRKPNTQEEWNQIITASYSQEELPDDMKTSSSQGLGMQGIRQSGSKFLSDTAQQRAVDFTSHGPTGINTLQMALKKKVGVGTPEGQEIGPSDIYKQAGLTGYGSLASSLNARANEIDAGYKKYTNWIDSAISGWSAEQTKLQNDAKLALDNYKIEMDEYNRLSDNLITKEESLIDHQREIDIIMLQDKLAKERDAINRANKATDKTITVRDEFTYWASQQGLNDEQADDIRYSENAPEWFKVDKTIFGEEGAKVSRIPTEKDTQKEWSEYRKEGLSKEEAKAVELTPQEVKRMSVSENPIPEDVARQINARKLRADSDESIIKELVDSGKYTQSQAEAIMKTYNDTINTQPSMSTISIE